MNDQGKRLAQVQGEDAQDGFGIHYTAARTQVSVIGVAVHGVDEGLYFVGGS